MRGPGVERKSEKTELMLRRGGRAFRLASVKDNWHAQLNPLAAPLPQPMFCVSEPLIAHKKPELHILLYTLRQYAAGYNSSVAAMLLVEERENPAFLGNGLNRFQGEIVRPLGKVAPHVLTALNSGLRGPSQL